MNRKELAAKCTHLKYYGAIKYMIHSIDDPEKKKELIKEISKINAFLAATVITTSCDKSDEIEQIIYDAIWYPTKGSVKISNNLYALLELDEYNEFYKYFEMFSDKLDKRFMIYAFQNLDCNKIMHIYIAMAINNNFDYFNSSIHMLQKNADSIDIALRNEVLNIYYNNGYYEQLARLCEALDCSQELCNILKINKEEIIIKLDISKSKYQMKLLLSLKYSCDKRKEYFNYIIENVSKLGCYYFLEILREYCENYELKKEESLKIEQTIGINPLQRALDLNISVNELLKGKARKGGGLFSINCTLESFVEEDNLVKYITRFENYNPYIFSLDRLKVSTGQDESVLANENNRFANMISNYTLPENVVKIYFNTSIKEKVNLEYLVTALIMKYKLSEDRLRIMLSNYTFRGRISRVNESSVSIRVYNAFCCSPARMNTSKYYVYQDGNKIELKKGDEIMFKFNYLSVEGRINVNSPTLI